jgi:hypothetical protein
MAASPGPHQCCCSEHTLTLTLAPPPPTPQVLDLVPLANKVEKLAGRCSHCDAPGLFSMRVAADSRQTLVGGSDKYVPACRWGAGAEGRGGGRQQLGCGWWGACRMAGCVGAW